MEREKLLDTSGRPLTQALFLELGYNTKYAIYTLKDWEHTYKGVTYPSIKEAYLNYEDPTEYNFANDFFLSWGHWKRICNNSIVAPYVEEWRDELELKLRAQGIQDIIVASTENGQGSFQASKWLADKGWDKRIAGRPSKEEKEKRLAQDDRIASEFSDDVARMIDYKKG